MTAENSAIVADQAEIARFVNALFRYATGGTFASLRAFYEDEERVFSIRPVELNGSGLDPLISSATTLANACAAAPEPVVFAPIVATFTNPNNARQIDLANGLVLSVECDERPQAARKRLEGLLGPATIVVASGGTWVDPDTGEIEDRLHLHWRLTEPTTEADGHRMLKEARRIATALVGGDASNVPAVHPIRWPGSVHRKAAPRLARIIAETDHEIELIEAAEILKSVPSPQRGTKAEKQPAEGGVYDFNKQPDTIPLSVAIGAIERIPNQDLEWNDWNRVGMTLWAATGGTEAGFVAFDLWSQKSTKYDRAETRARWDHYASSPPDRLTAGTLIYEARKVDPTFHHPAAEFLRNMSEKAEAAKEADGGESGSSAAFAAPVEPVDLWGTIGAPELPTGLLPAVLERFAIEQAEMMGTDPGGLAASALAVCAAAIPDRIKIQVKRHDPHWLESARLWVALIGTPSAKKSPIISQAVKPLTRLDAKLYRDYAEALAKYNALPKEERATSAPPKQKRLRIEDATVESAQQVLGDSPDGVLLIQDEMSGWFGRMDAYSGNKGAAKDRSFWLQSFNGGPYALNRVGRGASLIENLSVSMLGGIQPGPIRELAAEAHDDGLLQRLFPIVLRSATVGKDEPPSDVVAQYGRLIERLTQLQPPEAPGNLGLPEATPLKFDDGAQAIRRDLEQRHHDLMSWETINPKLAAHVGKLDGLFARLCIVWHCVENGDAAELPPVVTERTAKRVAAFMQRFLFPHAAAFFHGVLGLSDDHDRLAAVAGYILARKLERLTSRDIQRGDRTMRGLTRHDRERVFEQLEALGWIEQTPGPRPSDPPHWIVNPAVHQRFADRAKQEAQRRKAAHAMILELTRAA